MFCALLVTAATVAQEPPAPPLAFDVPAACAQASGDIGGIEQRYAGETKQLEQDGAAIEDRAKGTHHIAGEIRFKERAFSFDVPRVTMKPKTMSLGIPSVTMKVTKFSFDKPVVRMENRTVGWVPDGMTCHWLKCTVKKKLLIIKVPVTRMERQEFKTSVPQTRMIRRDFVTNIPEFAMRRIGWSMKIPEFIVKSPIPGEDDSVNDASARLQARGEALATRINADVVNSTSALFKCVADDLVEKRKDAALQFEIGINQLSATIDTLQAAGADPAAAEGEDGKVNYVQQRIDLMAERDRTLAGIDDAITALGAEQTQKVEQTHNSVS